MTKRYLFTTGDPRPHPLQDHFLPKQQGPGPRMTVNHDPVSPVLRVTGRGLSDVLLSRGFLRFIMEGFSVKLFIN